MKKLLVLTVILGFVFSSQIPAKVKPTLVYNHSVEAYKKRRYNDSLEIQYLNYKLDRARFYVNLCNKKPSQRKFLLGWMNRTLK